MNPGGTDPEATDALSAALDQVKWQAALFADRLNRLDLLRLRAPAATGARPLLVIRNHAFETVASALAPFLTFADVPLTPEYSDYDDSLALPWREAPAVLVWMDFARLERLADEELAAWATSRLDLVRAHTGGALVVANAPDGDPRAAKLNAALENWAARAPGAAILKLDEVAAELGEATFDVARAAATGTRLSDQAALQAGRKLAFEILPAALGRPIKAIAVDLDNTLYRGVLGEDGADGVQLTPDHARLQQALADWAARGVLVAVISRNVAEDVTDLFARRGDFPLRPDMVADWEVGWSEKSGSVARAAARFNIAPDSFLFVDDNAGELIEAGRAHPGLRLLFAGDASRAAAALRRYPGLPFAGAVFAGRAADIQANQARAALAAQATDEAAYLRALQPVLAFALNPTAELSRLAELSRKTNQFNLALRRFTEVDVQRYLADPDKAVVHVRLSDRLADSGSVAALFFRRDDGRVVVDELCISCRALGRKLEDVIIAEAARRASQVLGATPVAFAYATGPRNAPARDWLSARANAPATSDHGEAAADLGVDPAVEGAIRLTWAT